MSVAALKGPAAGPAMVAPVAASPSDPGAKIAAPPASAVAISTAAPAGPLHAARLTIEFDDAAERFVQTLIDPTSQSVLRRFPNESQLAFSRGVNAYMAALQRP